MAQHMTQDQLKQAVAAAAADLLASKARGAILGVGTGSTANFFVDALAERLRDGRLEIAGTVASSEATAQRLQGYGIEVLDLNSVESMPVYVDGADEINGAMHMLKGGGGALTREKIVAAVAGAFICIADQSKRVEVLGKFPLPVEVIPMAQAQVTRALACLGGYPKLREGFRTDNGNLILDVHGLSIGDPVGLERDINQIAGVVCNGLFASRKADVLITGGEAGVQQLGDL